jgi:hypothetical protein
MFNLLPVKFAVKAATDKPRRILTTNEYGFCDVNSANFRELNCAENKPKMIFCSSPPALSSFGEEREID